MFEASMEDVQHIRFLLNQTSVQNNEITLQIKAKVKNDSQMYHLKMNKSVLQKGIIFILCICILFSICPVYAFAAGNQKEKIVRIGVPDAKYVKS